MRRLALLLTVVSLLAIAGVAAAGTTEGPKVTVFGDSVADKMQRNPAALAALNDGYTLDLQTRGCRRLVSPSCTIVGSSGTPTSVLPLVKSLAGRIGKIVVVDVGYNDTPSHYDRDLDMVMRSLQNAGVKTVVWLTLRDPVHVYKQANEGITTAPKAWPTLVIADWNTYSSRHTDWFESDGIHLTALGAANLGEFIDEALDSHLGRS